MKSSQSICVRNRSIRIIEETVKLKIFYGLPKE